MVKIKIKKPILDDNENETIQESLMLQIRRKDYLKRLINTLSPDEVEFTCSEINKRCEEEIIYKPKFIKSKLLYEDSIVFERLFFELNEMRKIINDLKDEIGSNKKIPILMELKKEPLIIDQIKVVSALSMANILGDIMLFKLAYMKTEMKPIRIISPRRYEYWANSKWNLDDGSDIIDIISNNLKMAYLKVNTPNNFEVEHFIKNQEHIYELSNDKYKRELLKAMTKVLNA